MTDMSQDPRRTGESLSSEELAEIEARAKTEYEALRAIGWDYPELGEDVPRLIAALREAREKEKMVTEVTQLALRQALRWGVERDEARAALSKNTQRIEQLEAIKRAAENFHDSFGIGDEMTVSQTYYLQMLGDALTSNPLDASRDSGEGDGQ